GEKTLQLVRHGMPRLLDRLLHDIARTLVVPQTGRQHLAKRRIAGELFQHLRIHALLPIGVDHFAEQIGWHDFFSAQHHQALDDQGYRDDRGDQQRINRPARGGDERKQLTLLKIFAAVTLASAGLFSKAYPQACIPAHASAARYLRNCGTIALAPKGPFATLISCLRRAPGTTLESYPQFMWIKLCIVCAKGT